MTGTPSDPLSPETLSALVCELVRIPSVNPSIAPREDHGEARIAAFARDWLSAHGVDAWLEGPRPDRPNAVARVGTGQAPILVLCAHLDTVGTEGMTDAPFEPRIEGDRIHGRGSYDMKGSVAAVMAAMAALAHEPLAGTVLAALVADEEHGSLGALDFTGRHRADACIVTEPSEGVLVLAHKGFVWARIETRGRAAHGSRPDLGLSAIARMAPIVQAIDAFDRDELRRRVHPLAGAASMHCAMIAGGTALSVYAHECTLEVERRTIPGETPEQVRHELNTLVGRIDPDATVTCYFDRHPLVCAADSPIASCVRESATRVTGAVPPDGGVGYWMDAALFAQCGVPTVNYGPSGAGAHEAVEWVSVSSVVQTAHVLVESARQFCRQTSGRQTSGRQTSDVRPSDVRPSDRQTVRPSDS